jgi:predicted Zn-dependent protease
VIKLPEKKYTPKQDVQLGKEAVPEVRKQYPIIEDQHIAKYLTQIGNRLVAAARHSSRDPLRPRVGRRRFKHPSGEERIEAP